ncbi:aromatic ring-opening dioxygenase LigA [Arachnia propionica]|uniref:Aromatic ring-opening dioxygenase LigA n=1 Tax=Arachnia propionica TaxID=1750 RepID=A0A3P1WP25_9ACTN|nr:aromatic ring-opening dioxygenase LigA [Arachnia propionica]RRD48379.1 aromatic ring-opening dioxygenase LigA [Arachnia propionica]
MKSQKVIGIVSIIVGVVMLVSGAIAWAVTSSQLAAEKITVPQDAIAFQGSQVKGPLTAYVQADIISKHAAKQSEGLTFAELGVKVREAKEAGNTELAEKYQSARDVVQTASFLRASLFTSVLAFGVSALVMGVGLMFGLIGWSMTRNKERDVVKAEEVTA